MKKTTSLMLALLFSGVMLLGEAINTTTKAAVADTGAADGFYCNILTGCTGDACCAGQGRGFNCLIACADGSDIICPKADIVVVAAATDGN